MYCKCTEVNVKESIIQNFCDPKGSVRVIIATIAFGMGLDCPDVRQTVLWGAPSDMETMIQQQEEQAGMVSYPVHYCYTVSVTYTLSLSQCNNSVKVLIYVEGTCYFAGMTSMNTLTVYSLS